MTTDAADFPDAHPNVTIPPDAEVGPFCAACAEAIRGLAFDPEARPRPELMTGSCLWSDERPKGAHPCMNCISPLRRLFAIRYDLTIGAPVSAETRAAWDRLEGLFPDWPLLRPERRSPAIAGEVRRLVAEMVAREIEPAGRILEAELAADVGEPLARRWLRKLSSFIGGDR